MRACPVARWILALPLFCTHVYAGDLEHRRESPVDSQPPTFGAGLPVDRGSSDLTRILDHAAPRTPARLWEIFRSHARAGEQEDLFLSHPTFVSLGAAARREFYALMATEAPRRFLRVRNRIEAEAEPGELFGTLIERLESRLIRRTSRLSIRDQLGFYLGGSADPSGLPRGAKKQLSYDNRIDRVISDPSLASMPRIRDEWFEGLALRHHQNGLLYVDVREFVQCKIMIARNLCSRKEQATELSVRREYERILRLRDTYRDLELFSGRDVVYAASKQRSRKDGPFVFGHGRNRREIERQGARLSFFRGGSESAGRVKTRLSSELERAPQLTFLFEGHGRPRAIQIGKGLAADSLAAGIAARASTGEGGLSTSILIIMTCRGHDLSRSILERLHAGGASTPKPIIIVPEEFGQYFVTGLYSSPFLTRDLQLGRIETTTLGTVIDHARIAASVYVPDEDNLPAQIL